MQNAGLEHAEGEWRWKFKMNGRHEPYCLIVLKVPLNANQSITTNAERFILY